jgi:hypothetical protein
MMWHQHKFSILNTLAPPLLLGSFLVGYSKLQYKSTLPYHYLSLPEEVVGRLRQIVGLEIFWDLRLSELLPKRRELFFLGSSFYPELR